MTPEEALTKAKRILAGETGSGGQAALARALGISDAAVSQWKRCPASRVLAVEAATDAKVSRHDLRPDVFGAQEEAA